MGDKEQRSVPGQVQVCRACLAERGLPEGETFTDDGKSAWNPHVRRKDWERLMTRLESGESGGVIVFDLERFSRQPDDGSRLIKAAERGLLILDSDQQYDVMTASGRKAFRDALAAAEYYSMRLSDRVRRGKRAKAMDGEVNMSSRPFGFVLLPGGKGAVPHPEEAPVLREMTQRFLAGESQDVIIGDLHARGILTSYGKPWTRAGLRQVLSRPVNAGLVEYKGVIVGRLEGEPVISRDDYDMVLAVLAARKPGRPPSPHYLCSGVAVCGLCGTRLAGRPRVNMKPYPGGGVKRQYWCAPSAYGGCGRIAIDQRALDEFALALLTAILSDPRNASALEAAAAQRASEAADLDIRIARDEELALRLSERLGNGMPLERYDAAMRPVDKRLAVLRDKRRALDAPGAPQAAVVKGADWKARVKAAGHAEKRAMLRMALQGRPLVVGPADRGRHTEAGARVTLGKAPG